MDKVIEAPIEGAQFAEKRVNITPGRALLIVAGAVLFPVACVVFAIIMAGVGVKMVWHRLTGRPEYDPEADLRARAREENR
jgi:hypothetical protein